MIRLSRILLATLLILTLSFALFACGDADTPQEGGNVPQEEEVLIKVVSIDLTAQSDNVRTYTITFSDGTTFTYEITNGIDGLTPHIGTNGNWWVGDVDTEVSAYGLKGEKGDKGDPGATGATAWASTILPAAHGYVTVNVGSAIVGDTVTFTIVPDAGYRLTELYINGVLQDIGSDTTLELDMVEGGFVVRPVFEEGAFVYNLTELNNICVNGGHAVLANDLVYNGSFGVYEDAVLDLNGHTLRSANNVAIKVTNGATLVINGEGNVIAQEACAMAFSGSTLIINGGTYTAIDNFVVGTNGTSGKGGNTITINGGTFNGGIQSAGYVACGIYVANNDTVTVNGGTFNITNGVGILARSGNTTIGEDVTFNVTGDNTLGKVGDSKVTVPSGAIIVQDLAAGYPGGVPTVTNNATEYDITTTVLVSTFAELQTAVAQNNNNIIVNANFAITEATAVTGKNVILNLNGHTLTGEELDVAADGSLILCGGGLLDFTSWGMEVRGELTVNGANIEAVEQSILAMYAAKVTINDGTFTSTDNAVIATHGSAGRGGNVVTINGGTFNGSATTAGYIGCGVYVANDDTFVINGGTFNVQNGAGIVCRSGNTTVATNVVINVTKDGSIESGKVGDSTIQINIPSDLVVDSRSGYPGGAPTLVNNTNYAVQTIQ